MQQFDGLERLIVVAIGLDAKIDHSEGTLETRSRLYRALTRAHMMALVVNEKLRGGWLEFLGSVRLKEDRFDARDAIGRCFGGRRLAFVGDSLAEQVSKAVLGMLGHAGHAATKTEHGDVFSPDKAPSQEEVIARPKKRHARYCTQRD